jgi:hypothetical protein
LGVEEPKQLVFLVLGKCHVHTKKVHTKRRLKPDKASEHTSLVRAGAGYWGVEEIAPQNVAQLFGPQVAQGNGLRPVPIGCRAML